MLQWIRRRFIAGFFVTVPLVISVAAFVWIFRLIDGFVGPFYAAWLGRELPGLGILTTALVVLLVGALATNVIGKQLLQRATQYDGPPPVSPDLPGRPAFPNTGPVNPTMVQLALSHQAFDRLESALEKLDNN